MSTEQEEWGRFREYLIEHRGLATTTARTTAGQVRRIFREVQPVTQEGLRAWEKACPMHHVRAYRASYRRYREFSEAQWGVSLPDFSRPPVPDEGMPEEVLEALHLAMEEGVAASTIVALGHRVIPPGHPLHDALASGNMQIRTGRHIVIHDTEGRVATVPKHCWDVWSGWAWPDGVPSPEMPALPKRPGSDEPMPLAKVRRLVRNYRKAQAEASRS